MLVRYLSAAGFTALAIVLFTSVLPAGVDQGMARHVPWSGSYWPIREGALIRGPLTKYDQATGHQAAAWELQQNPPDGSVPEWFGYCHAWAAAAVLDPEPLRLRNAPGIRGQLVPFGIGDQKGMLTACHTDDVAQHYGVRFEGQPGEDPQDIYPDQLWRVLKLFIQKRGIPLIVDIEGGTQVWNYPVYAYRVDYRPSGSGHWYLGTMTLWMADDAVPEDIVGVQVSKQTYYFTFELRNGAAQLGTGRWVEPSINNHPDFAWYPYVVRAENPELRYDKVKLLVDRSGVRPGEQPGTGPESDPSSTTEIPLNPHPANPLVPILPSTVPPSTVPPNTVPPNTVPPNTVPPNTVPPNTVPTPLPGGVPVESGSSAAPQPCLLSPVELLSLVTNRTSHFTLDVTVDKFDGGHYVTGEPISVRGTCERDAYLYVFYLDSQGGLSVLFPGVGDANLQQAEHRFQLPAPNGGRMIRAANTVGVHRIKAVATRGPLMLTGLSRAPAIEADGATGPSTFRLPPCQESMYRNQLTAHVQGKRPPSKSVGRETLAAMLGQFAQDEVAFYVGAPDAGAPVRER